MRRLRSPPPDTERCFNVEMWSISGCDVDQPRFNVGSTSIVSTLNSQRCNNVEKMFCWNANFTSTLNGCSVTVKAPRILHHDYMVVIISEKRHYTFFILCLVARPGVINRTVLYVSIRDRVCVREKGFHWVLIPVMTL